MPPGQSDQGLLHRRRPGDCAVVEAVAEKDGEEVVDACSDHWDDLGERVETHMGIDLATADPIENTLATARQRFVTRLRRSARQGIGNLKVRTHLAREKLAIEPRSKRWQDLFLTLKAIEQEL